jgi:hypothetical protein
MSKTVDTIGPSPGNGAQPDIDIEQPFIVQFTVKGTVPFLFHRWNNEAVEEKAKAKRGSEAKKTDNIESYVYRNPEGEICIPGAYVHAAMVKAAKYRQDPRSTRKSAMDLYKAAIAPNTELATLGKSEWDFVDMRRVRVNQSGITRHRPAFYAGWEATWEFTGLLPEYVSPADFLDVLTLAGRVEGLGDFRPTYGRFAVVHFETIELS